MHALLLLLLPALIVAAPSEANATPFLAIPEVDRPPVIDGRVEPGEWQAAAVTCGFRDTGTGLPARAQVVVSACYDARNLYCLYECFGEKLGELQGGSAERDTPVYTGSEVELFLAPESWPLRRYAHFMLNHAGAIMDEMCDAAMDPAWNPDWQHATGKTDTAWIAELAIPWASLDLAEPQAGAVFRANFGRNAASINELPTWAPVRGGFHRPEQFGRLKLVGRGAVAAVRALPGRATGPAPLEARLAGSPPAGKGRVELRAELTPQRRFSAVFADQQARMTLEVPNGTSGLEVSVRERGGETLWQQSVELDLPDLPAAIRAQREALAALDSDRVPAADLAGLGRDLDHLDRRASQPLGADGLARVAEDLDRVSRRITDLARLADVRRGRRQGELPSYFVTNPVVTEKIQPNAGDPGPLARTLRIAMAKAEYEPVQLAVCAVGADLKAVRVSAGSLLGPGEKAIPPDRVVVTPMGFVRCEKSTAGARLRGEIPDVLLPNRAMDVPAGRRQPFLITVQSTPDDAPGEYRGTVIVKPENAPETRLPLTVRIYNVTLPVKSHLRTAFCLWGGFRGFLESTGPGAYLDTYLRYSKAMLAHRLSPITMWSPKNDARGAWDFSDYDRYLSELVPLGLTTANIGGNGEVAGSRNTDFAQAAARHLKERGWWDLHYVYGYDEAPGSALDQLKTNYGALMQAVPDLEIMQTGWSPTPVLQGLVKIWCPLTAGANREAIRSAQKAGDEVWWYVCCGPTAPYANLFVDYPGVDHRVLGWQTFQKGIQGFLYWGADVWPGNTLKLEEYDRADYLNWNPNSFDSVNGDGYLLYPGRGDAPIPSLRIALLRDGFEDYDLFTEAKALASRSGAQGEPLRALLNFDGFLHSLTDYTQDGRELLSRREAVLREAEKLGRAR